MKPYFHDLRFAIDVASRRAETEMRRWFLANPEPPRTSGDWPVYVESLRTTWDATFRRELSTFEAIRDGRS